MSDPRVEAAADAMRNPKPNQIKYGEDLEEWVDRVMPVALAAADAADREQGIHRVRVDDATVERVAVALMNSQHERHGLPPRGAGSASEQAYIDARAVLAALTGAES